MRHLSLNFGDAAAEYRAATESAAIVDVSDRTQLRLSGADRHSFFHGFCTNDIKGLSPGHGCEAFLCNVKGRILGHVFVFADEQSLWIESVPDQGPALLSHLNRYHLVEEIELSDQTDSLAEFAVIGPQAADRLHASGLDISDLASWQHRSMTWNGPEEQFAIHVKAIDVFGGRCFLITMAKSQADHFWDHVTGNGFIPAGRQAFETIRIESGFPCYGIDLSDANLAQEAARTDRAISFQKGCYLGQEPIARLNAMGHVNRALASFTIDAPEVPPTGTTLRNPTNAEKEAGVITSAAWSWSTDQPVGLGMVRAQFLKPGTELPAGDDSQFTVTIRSMTE